MTERRPSLLFFSPCAARDGHTGLAMRALATSRHLGLRHDVRIVTTEGAKLGLGLRLRRWVRFAAPRLSALVPAPPWDWMAARVGAAASACSDVDRVHVFRLGMAPYAAAAFGRCPCSLDLDESESRTRRDIAALARANGERGLAAVLSREADFYERAEREWLPRFDRVFAASRQEAERIAAEVGVDVGVLPNVVRLPPRTSPDPSVAGARLLFVGSLGYYPNHDAVIHFVRDVLPLCGDRRRGDVRLIVVGGGAAPRLRKVMASDPRVEYRGFVEHLAAHYAQADVVVAPLRAGGGTRLKLLEAFAYGVPVVSTAKAAEGLDVTDGVECLLVDSPEGMAHACRRLLDDAALRGSLAARARSYVEERHGPAALDSLA